MKQLYIIHFIILKIIKMLCNILTVIHVHLFLFLRTTQTLENTQSHRSSH